MQHPKLSALTLVLAASAAMSASADIIVTAPPVEESQTIVVAPPTAVVVQPVPAGTIVLPVAPNPVPDPAADAKCRYLAPPDYWDCVNSHSGG